MQNNFSYRTFPPAPTRAEDAVAWARNFTTSISTEFFWLDDKVAKRITYGVTADLPDSVGSGNLYYDTTLSKLQIDLDSGWADVGGVGGTSHHGDLSGLSDDDHTQYLLASGTRALSADWDAGGFEIRAQTFESDVATGTAPLTIASTTKVANLNADLLDGSEASAFAASAHTHADYLNKNGTVALTADWDAGSFEIRAQTFESDVTAGTAPFTVASNTVVTNLNSDLLDGEEASAFADAAHDHSGTYVEVGTFSSEGFTKGYFTYADGGTGFSVITSADVNTNNVATIAGEYSNGNLAAIATLEVGPPYFCLIDSGYDAGDFAAASHSHADYLNKNGTVALTAAWDAGSYEITAEKFKSDVATGTAPLTVASTTVVTNLNADTVDGIGEPDIVRVDGSHALTGDWDAGGYEIRSNTFESDVATGTAPFTIASTTVCTNLNADLLDGKHSTSYLSSTTPAVKITIYNGSGGNFAAGDLLYVSGASGGNPSCAKADADAASTCSKMLVIAGEAINDTSTGSAIAWGYVDLFSSLTAGAIQYVSTTAGAIAESAPTGTTDIVRIVGYALSTTAIFFMPDNTYIELA